MNSKNLYLYETDCDLSPLDILRFQCDIYVGARTIRERFEDLFICKAKVIAKKRKGSIDIPEPTADRPFGPGLFCPSNFVPRSPIAIDGSEEVGVDGDRIVFLRLGASRAVKFDPKNPEASAVGLPRRPLSAAFIDKPWDIIRYLHLLLNDDAEFEIKNGADTEPPPNAVFDRSGGPIAICDGAKIEPFVFISGPAVIGRNAVVKSHSAIRASAINEGSRVGGELNSTVFFPYSNKQHYGFLGHSVAASWVNIGAGAAGSNLKNTYGEIRIDGEGTGLNYLGQIIGDHTKIGIQAALNTGSIFGICSNIIADGITPKSVESFRFGNEPAEIESVIKTARRVMARRNKELTSSMEELIRAWHRVLTEK